MDRSSHPLSEYLKLKPISQTDFAKEVGISRTHLYRIMRGDSTSLATITAISKATGNVIPAYELMKAVKVKQSEDAR